MKHLHYILVTVGLMCFAKFSQAQDKAYARQVIDTLCSPAFYGRGYVNDGDRKAAAYLSGEFQKIGLQTFGSSYEQPFTLSVNTLPSKLRLRINGETLEPGVDYLLDPASPTVSSSYKTVALSLSDLLDEQTLLSKLKDAEGEFLLIESFDRKSVAEDRQQELNDLLNFLKYHPQSPAAGIILLTKDKLTWHGATQQYVRPVLYVREDAIDRPIDHFKLKADSEFIESHEARNLIGYLPGQSDSLLVFTAHYDHLGMMGKRTMFPGANDNASGVALLLDLARHYSQQEERPYTMVFIAFAGEELGLLGSKYFTEHPMFSLKQIRFLINFDISGTGDEGIQVVNGSVFFQEFEKLEELNRELDLLPQVKTRGEACNSDHCLFYQKGVPCFYIYTLGGIKAYHDIYDKAETLPLTAYENYFKLLTAFVSEL